MKYKKISVVFLIITVAVLLTVYMVADTRIRTNPMTANHMIYENLEQLDHAVELIVIAKATGKRENIVHGKDIMDSNGYTMTEISIKRILKNEINEKISPGDKMKISEPYYILDKGVIPGKVKNIYSEYSEILDDALYILYLKWYKGSHSYSVHALNQGKYNIDGKDLYENKTIEQSNTKRIKVEVLEEYEAEISSLQ